MWMRFLLIACDETIQDTKFMQKVDYDWLINNAASDCFIWLLALRSTENKKLYHFYQ
jgi:hypothetical protein